VCTSGAMGRSDQKIFVFAIRLGSFGGGIGTGRAVKAASSWSFAAEICFCSKATRRTTLHMAPSTLSPIQGRKTCRRGLRAAACQCNTVCGCPRDLPPVDGSRLAEDTNNWTQQINESL
jgi:hypothetical protein